MCECTGHLLKFMEDTHCNKNFMQSKFFAQIKLSLNSVFHTYFLKCPNMYEHGYTDIFFYNLLICLKGRMTKNEWERERKALPSAGSLVHPKSGHNCQDYAKLTMKLQLGLALAWQVLDRWTILCCFPGARLGSWIIKRRRTGAQTAVPIRDARLQRAA